MPTITHTHTESDFTIQLSPPINLDPNKKYEAALLSINLYNSIPNITEENNTFLYSPDNGKSWKTITLNKGSYEIQAINDEIQRQMIINGDYDAENNKFYITLSADIAELKSIIDITNKTYLVDFDVENSIGPTLGFYSKETETNQYFNKMIEYGYNKSHNIVDITKINLVLVNIDIISGSYVNGNQSPCIYSFDPYKVPPGYKLDERPNPTLIFYPINRTNIHSLRIWLTDQNNKTVDFRGEKITIKIYIRKKLSIKQEIIKAIKNKIF
jgi:hypothetical protein